MSSEIVDQTDMERPDPLEGESSAPVGLWEYDLATGEAWCSAGHDRIFGYSERVPEWSYRRFLEHVHPDDAERVKRSFRDAIERTATWDMQLRIRVQDGGIRRVRVYGEPRHSEDGRPVRYVGTVEDLSLASRTREELRESRELGHIALRAAGLGVWYADLESHEVSWDARAREIFGVGDDDDLDGGRIMAEIIHPDDVELVEGAARSAFEADRDGQYLVEHRIVRDGEIRWLAAQGRVIFSDRDGQRIPSRMIGVVRDVTERKEAERALAESEERYRRIGEAIPYGVWITEPDGLCTYVSKSFLDMAGMTLEEVQEYGWLSLLTDPEEAEKTRLAWERCVQERGFWDREHTMHDRDGNERTILARGLPVLDREGEIRSWVGINLDITQRKAAEKELQAKTRMLEAADRQKDHFLALLGHELRNPLAALANGLELRERGIEPARGWAWLDRMMRDQLTTMSGLLDDLLDITRMSRGKIRIQRAPVALKPAVDRALDVLRPPLVGKGREVEVSVPEDLFVHADASRLEQILVNLLSNAVKYTPDPGRIALSAVRDADRVRVAVVDEGIGIAPEDAARIFEPFVQTADEAEGLGIGLALVHQLVRLHEGTIEVRSEGAGQGATFEFELPAAEPVITPAVATEQPRPDPTEPVKVLLVEDNRDAATALAEVLRELGHVVEVADDGETALRTGPAFGPDLVLTDIGLPDMTGYEVARRLRAAGLLCHTLMVASTGFSHPEARVQSSDAGFDRHLVKPVPLDTILELVREAAERRRLATGSGEEQA